jgi:hypothetical protein
MGGQPGQCSGDGAFVAMDAEWIFTNDEFSAVDTVTVRACNIDPSNKQPGSGAIRVDLWKH